MVNYDSNATSVEFRYTPEPMSELDSQNVRPFGFGPVDGSYVEVFHFDLREEKKKNEKQNERSNNLIPSIRNRKSILGCLAASSEVL